MLMSHGLHHRQPLPYPCLLPHLVNRCLTLIHLTQPPNPPSKELYVRIHHISKIYSDDMGRFPVRSYSGNEYIMLAYHVDTNM